MADKAATEKAATGLIPAVESNLPISTVDNKVYDDLATSSSFLGRLQLFSSGTAISKGLIASGEWGIPKSKDEINVLGKSIDFLVLTRRPKALDISDTEAIIQDFDPNSAEFKRIAAASSEKDSGCMYGVSFLVLERSTGLYLEYYAGTKTARGLASDLFPFIPEAGATSITAVTATSRLIEKGTYAWQAPVFKKCSTPIQIEDTDRLREEMTKFLNPSRS